MVFFDLGRKTQDYETRNARPLGARTYVDRSVPTGLLRNGHVP